MSKFWAGSEAAGAHLAGEIFQYLQPSRQTETARTTGTVQPINDKYLTERGHMYSELV